MTEAQSPTLWSAIGHCFASYLAYFGIGLVVAIVLLIPVPPLGALVFFASQLIAVATASYRATKAYDARHSNPKARASGLLLVGSYSLVLTTPWIGLVALIAPFLPDTMAGGYVLAGLGLIAVVAGPVSTFIGTTVGVFIAR